MNKNKNKKNDNNHSDKTQTTPKIIFLNWIFHTIFSYVNIVG